MLVRLPSVARAVRTALPRLPTSSALGKSIVRVAWVAARAATASAPSRSFVTAGGKAPAGPPAPPRSTGPYIIEITKDNFDAEVNKSDRPVILDVYADWCVAGCWLPPLPRCRRCAFVPVSLMIVCVAGAIPVAS